MSYFIPCSLQQHHDRLPQAPPLFFLFELRNPTEDNRRGLFHQYASKNTLSKIIQSEWTVC